MIEKENSKNQDKNSNEKDNKGFDLNKLVSSSDVSLNLNNQNSDGFTKINSDNKLKGEEKLDLNKNKIESSVSEKLIFGDDGMQNVFKKIASKHFYGKLFAFMFISSIIFSFLSLGLYVYNSYLNDLRNPGIESKYEEYIKKYKNEFYDLLSVFMGKNIDKIDVSLNHENGKADLESFLNNKNISYVDKKDTLQNKVNDLIRDIIMLDSNINNYKDHSTKYGYFTEDLKNLLQDQENMSSIKRSILSLENIKFSSAVHVFYYLDVFVDGLSKLLGIEKAETYKKMESIIARGERDIMLYLDNCYLNPYEMDYLCDSIGDFDFYYKNNGIKDMDIDFFKKLMYYIDLKIEQSDVPSFSILFNGFNSNNDNISFTIDINTFEQDKLALIAKKIQDPHVFIVNKLINFLKQSKFIIGKNIVSNNIKIIPDVVNIGSSQFNVSKSSLKFSLPIQNSMEREIYDFVDIK